MECSEYIRDKELTDINAEEDLAKLSPMLVRLLEEYVNGVQGIVPE